MRLFVLCVLLSASIGLAAQAPSIAGVVTQPDTDLRGALEGDWVGVLEYRDYHEASDSLKRVDLPTWLAIRGGGAAQQWHFVYDDGPGKTVDSAESVTFDAMRKTYEATLDGNASQTFAVACFETLKQGHGVLVMGGAGSDNDKAADVRLTLTVRRNLMELLQEVRPAGTSDAYSFRHLYRMVRATAPAVTQR